MKTEGESLASLGPQLTSISSRVSLEIYENLKLKTIHLEQSQADLDTLVDAAGKIINENSVPSVSLHAEKVLEKYPRISVHP